MNEATAIGGRSEIMSGKAQLPWLGLVVLVLATALVSANWATTQEAVDLTGGRITPALTYIREAPATGFERPVSAQTFVREAPAQTAPRTITETHVGAREATG